MTEESGKRTLRPRAAKRKSMIEDEAELGADLLIFEFESGVLNDCPNGTTLKAYLSSKIELSDFAAVELIEQGVDFSVPYCHFGSDSTGINSPSPKKKTRGVNIVTPPVQARRTPSSSFSSPSMMSKHALLRRVPSQSFQFEYQWDSSVEDNDCSPFLLPGLTCITPTPFTADPEKLLAAKVKLMDEQAKQMQVSLCE